MKNNTKRIFISILTLVLTVVAVGTTTFAWFSLSNVATISNIGGSVQGGEGLEVRIVHDGEGEIKSNFRTNLSDTDWGNFLKANEIHSESAAPFKFGAVSTDDGVDFNHLTQVTGTSNLTLEGLTDGANKQYLEFELEFRSLDKGTINLTKLDFDKSGSITWSNTGGEKYKQIDDSPTNDSVVASPRNAARVGFYNTNNSEALNVFQESSITTGDYNANGYKVTYGKIEGNNFSTTTPVSFGQYSFLTDSKNTKIVTGEDTLLDITSIDMIEAKDLTNPMELEKVTVDLPETPNQGTYHTVSITVRIWIEGWDADAYDAIFLQKLNVNMSFAKKEQ